MNALHLPDSPDSLAHLRTRIANQSAGLGAVLERKLRSVQLGTWSIELVAQDCQSTGSGIRARQNLVLVPGVPGDRSFVVGSVCSASLTAQVRSFDEIAAIHQARMGARCSFTPADHVGFVTDLAIALATARIRLEVLTPDAAARRSSSAPPPMIEPQVRSVGLAPIGGAIALAIAICAVWLEFVTPLVR